MRRDERKLTSPSAAAKSALRGACHAPNEICAIALRLMDLAPDDPAFECAFHIALRIERLRHPWPRSAIQCPQPLSQLSYPADGYSSAPRVQAGNNQLPRQLP